MDRSRSAGAAILNYYDLGAERGLSTFDTPHNLVASAVYDLPFGRGRRFGRTMPAVADAIVGGWTVSTIARWQSGVPISISRPSVRDGRDASLDDPTIERWFDTTVFSPAAPFTFGNVGRTLTDVRADGVKNVDMTFSKNVRRGALSPPAQGRCVQRVQPHAVRRPEWHASPTPRLAPSAPRPTARAKCSWV